MLEQLRPSISKQNLTARLLRKRKSDILREWREWAIPVRIDPLKNMDRDSHPSLERLFKLLDQLADSLDAGFLKPSSDPDQNASRSPLLPTHERDFDQVQAGLRLLQKLIFHALDQEGHQPGPRDRDIILEFIQLSEQDYLQPFRESERPYRAAFEDISERKAVERSCQEANERAEEAFATLNAMIDAAPVGVAILDRDFRYLKINQVLADINGSSIQEHLGRTVTEVLGEEGSKAVVPALQSILQTGRPLLNAENPNVRKNKDDPARAFLGNFFPIRREGSIWAIGAMIIDITERKRQEEEQLRTTQRLIDLQQITEAALSRSSTLEELLRLVLERIGRSIQFDTAAFLLLDSEEQILEARATLGLAEGSDKTIQIPKDKGITGGIYSTGKARRIDDMTRVEAASPVIKERGIQCLIGAPLRTKTHVIGVLLVGRIKSEPYSDDDLRLLQLIADRIAAAIDNARLYSALGARIKDLQLEKELREQFVSSLTHDLRNPLAAARISAQVIQRNPGAIDRIPGLATRIAENLQRADQMIQDLLDSNRIRAGQGLLIEPVECDLLSLVRTVSEEMTLVYGERVQVQASAPRIIGYWDCQQLRRALENLVTNGLKYGDPRFPVTIAVSEIEGSAVTLTVHNRGNPIPEDEQHRLFERFERGSQSLGTRGWGIGLTLVRGVAEAHRGHVSLKSDKEEGTTFSIELPRDSRSKQTVE